MKDLTLKERIAKRSPKLFRNITNFGVMLAGVGGAVLTLATGGIALPLVLVTYSGYAVAIGTALAIPSKLTVENKKDEEK